jgi:tetratricopeptide (TPR) repeat protein
LRPDRGLDFHAANLRARTGDFEGGAALLERMLDENPDDDEVLYQLGVLYGVAQETDRALYYMQEVLARNPDNAQALNYIGYTWVERGQNLDEAERMIEHAVRLSPDDGYIADSLAWVYYMKARPLMGGERRSEGVALLNRAVEQLDLAVELTGGDPVVSEHLGDVYLLLDEEERALHFYREAVGLEPREDEQPKLYEKLDRLQRELGRDPKSSSGEASDER